MDKDQFKRIMSYAESAMSLLKKSKIPPTPQFFELLYTYATGAKPALNDKINAFFERGEVPDTNAAADLHTEFVKVPDMEEKLTSVSAEIATRIDAVHGDIDKAFANANSYSGLLQSAAGDLETGLDPAAVTALARGLLDETRKMQAANRVLEERLGSARSDIGSLQRELDEVRRESMLDPLTKLQNRKSFDRDMDTAIRNAEQNGEAMSLLLIDVDHFKQFNDTYGHQTGDQVLKLVAMTLQTAIRDTDSAARYGGEEFAAILPGASLKEAMKSAEGLRKAIQSKELLKRSTNEKLGRVTASIGVATFRSGDTASSMIERADRCLYAAKEQGRNRVVDEDGGSKGRGNTFAA